MATPAFPSLPGLSFPVTRTPIWSTIKQDSVSGKSSPLQMWTYPRRRYQLVFDMLRSGSAYNELQALEGFYNSVGGAAGAFLFTDVDDQTATSVLFGSGDGVTGTFQLVRPWGVVPNVFYEPVFLPRGFTISVAGAATSAYAIGANPGQIVFSSAPSVGAALLWTGGFDWLCRFDDDSYDFSKFMNGLWSQGGMSFTTVKLL